MRVISLGSVLKSKSLPTRQRNIKRSLVWFVFINPTSTIDPAALREKPVGVIRLLSSFSKTIRLLISDNHSSLGEELCVIVLKRQFGKS